MENDLPPQIAMTQMILGYVPVKAIHAAAKLNIAELLATHGPMNSIQLAEKTDTHPEAVYRLLRALASNGIFREGENGKFELTPLAECLKEDSPNSTKAMALSAGNLFYRAFTELMYAVRHGGGGWVEALGAPPFEYLRDHPEEGKIFDRMMTDIHGGETAPMVDNYDFSVFNTVVDIGGGNGEVISAILNENSRTKGILFDLPEVIDRSKENIKAGGLLDRCQLLTGDFFKTVPKGGDAYILRHIVHDWNDEDAISILTNCRKAMVPHGKVLVVEAVIPKGNDPHPFKWLDLTMLMIGGKERTKEQFEHIFSRAGLKLVRIIPATPAVSIVEGVAV
ncbi:methyltransferase [Pareuzebyella sediminis]|uniref:methyltransferase n=1 Tax=Pareuzebyella sediminis TaxID=2607998 RepID=UPI0011EEC37A|nr:methyltransferase [Pareuzebyella sediminis]